MKTTTTFSTTRQQTAAGALAFTLTLGMLLAVNGLATQGAVDARMAAAAAPVAAVPAATASGA